MQTRLSSLVLIAALTACSSPSKGPQGPGSDPAGSGSDTAGSGAASDSPNAGSAVQHDGPGMGQPCGPEGLCAPGLTCKKYYGIAGPRGPEFSSCEHTCATDADCDKGQRCATIADGPGQVCRGT